nr:AMP-binding protein [Sulfobacillus harzensis]
MEGKADDAVALWDVAEDFSFRTYTFGDLRRDANRVANGLAHLGVSRGDRVGILLSQSMELVVTHLATYLIGAIAVPLFVLFGDEAISYRINDAQCRLLVADAADWARLSSLRPEWNSVTHVLLTHSSEHIDPEVLSWDRIRDGASDRLAHQPTNANDPALVIYTSGTTGSPKGALHAHRVLLGHLPGVVMPHQSFPMPGDAMWTPADWAWIGGLLDVLLPSLFYGVPVVAYRARKFDPERTTGLLRKMPIRNVFFPPTALRLLRSMVDQPIPGVSLRTLASGGESLGADLTDWIRRVFGVVPAEFYGQTEANLLISNAPDVFPPVAGSIGRPVWGHEIHLLTERGEKVLPGEVGEITLALPDPVAFLRYWNRPDATEAKTAGQRIHTGDLARQDELGNVFFVGRSDDVINSAGYRMGPTEIEGVIATHPEVAMVAVIGKPDPIRGEIVKAFIVPRAASVNQKQVAREVQDLVRQRLGAHEYPREVEFVESLPVTATGKVERRTLRLREQAP